jgi:hypothetical protein
MIPFTRLGLQQMQMLGAGAPTAGLPRFITDLFNLLQNSPTYTGGPLTATDYLGNLVTSPAGVPALEGGRQEGITIGAFQKSNTYLTQAITELEVYSPPAYLTTLHVRPTGSTYGAGNGSSFVDALSGFASVPWGSVSPGTRLLLYGVHAEYLDVGASGTEENPIIIQAADPGISGVIDSENTRDIGLRVDSKNYVHLDGILSKNAIISCFETSGTSVGIVYNNPKGLNSGNQVYQALGSASATYYNIEGTGGTDDGFSMHDTTTAIIYGGTLSTNDQGINIIENANLVAHDVVLDNNATHDFWQTAGTGGVVSEFFNLTSGGLIKIDSGTATITNSSLTGDKQAQGGTLVLNNCSLEGVNTVFLGEIAIAGGSINGKSLIGASGGILNISKALLVNAGDHCVDTTGSPAAVGTVNVNYCIFTGVAALKFGIAVRTGNVANCHNNVFFGVGGVGRGFYHQGELNAKNNILVGLSDAFFTSAGRTGIVSHNALYGNTANFSGDGGSQTAGVTSDPLFVDATNADFSLQLMSPCFRAGVDVGLTSDYTGKTFDPYQWYDTEADGVTPIQASTLIPTKTGTKKWYQEPFASAFGYSNWPSRTNLFLNSTVPVTQNITTTAQAYTINVLGTGDVTVSGTATGTATEGSPLTVTATAGTLTCTVTGTLSRVQVEAGAFASPWIETAAAAVTRAATNLSNPLTLAPQMQLVVIPAATGTAGTLLDDGTNKLSYNGTNLIFMDGITTLSAAATLTAGTAYTIGVKGLAGDWALSLNTVDLDTDATGTVVAWATAKLGRNAADGDHFAGYFPNAAGFSGSDPLWYKTNLGA